MKVLRSEEKEKNLSKALKGGRQDLIDKEQREINVVEQYLPEEISEEDLIAKVKEVFDSSEDKVSAI